MKSSPPANPIPRDRDPDFYKPTRPNAEVEGRKRRFDAINSYISMKGGWVVSIPGSDTVTFECMPASTLPAELEAAGYDLVPADPPETSRILAAPIEVRMTLSSSGAFEEMTEGSTKPVAQIRTHAGIARVLRYSFMV
jgi:hypothetical protein